MTSKALLEARRSPGTIAPLPAHIHGRSPSTWERDLGDHRARGIRPIEDPQGEPVVVGTGLTYKLSNNVQFDAGVNVGVTRMADRINPFIGLSSRF